MKINRLREVPSPAPTCSTSFVNIVSMCQHICKMVCITLFTVIIIKLLLIKLRISALNVAAEQRSSSSNERIKNDRSEPLNWQQWHVSLGRFFVCFLVQTLMCMCATDYVCKGEKSIRFSCLHQDVFKYQERTKEKSFRDSRRETKSEKKMLLTFSNYEKWTPYNYYRHYRAHVIMHVCAYTVIKLPLPFTVLWVARHHTHMTYPTNFTWLPCTLSECAYASTYIVHRMMFLFN